MRPCRRIRMIAIGVRLVVGRSIAQGIGFHWEHQLLGLGASSSELSFQSLEAAPTTQFAVFAILA